QCDLGDRTPATPDRKRRCTALRESRPPQTTPSVCFRPRKISATSLESTSAAPYRFRMSESRPAPARPTCRPTLSALGIPASVPHIQGQESLHMSVPTERSVRGRHALLHPQYQQSTLRGCNLCRFRLTTARARAGQV